MADIFISYSRKDKAYIGRLHDALTRRQRVAWVDWEDIPPSVEWFERIKKGIEAARAFIFVISPQSVRSPICAQELEHAVACQKRLIPVVWGEVDAQEVPQPLRKLNWVFLREQDDFEAGVDGLLTATDTDFDWVDAHTNLLQKANEWARKGRDESRLLRGKDLREAEAWLAQSGSREPKPTELMGTFIVAGLQGETRRQRYTLGGVILVLMVVSILGLIAFLQYLESDRQFKEADRRGKIALSRQLAAQGENLLDSQPDLGLLLGVQAYRVAKTQEAKSLLYAGMTKIPEIKASFHGHEAAVRSVAFHPGSKMLASAADDGTIRLWDAVQERSLGSLRVGGHCLAFNRDGTILGSGGRDGMVRLWDPARRELLDTLDQRGWGAVHCLSFHPDGRLLAVGGERNTVIWDAISRRQLGTLIHGEDRSTLGTYALAFNRDGKMLASCNFDGKVRFWDMANLGLLGETLTGHGGPLKSLAFSPDGRVIAAGGDSGTIFLYDAATRLKLEPSLTGFAAAVENIVFSPDSKYVAAAVAGNLAIWEVASRRQLDAPVKGFKSQQIHCAEFSPDGKMLAAAGQDRVVRLWHWDRDHPLAGRRRPVQTGSGRLPGVGDFNGSVSPYRKLVAVATRDAHVIYWSGVEGPALEQSETRHAAPISKMAFGPDGKIFASGDNGGSIELWDSDSKQSRGPLLSGHNGRIDCLAFSPDSRILVSGSEDSTIRFWDVESAGSMGPPISVSGTARSWSPSHPKDAVQSLAFSANGKLLAVGSNSRVILVDVALMKPLRPTLEVRGIVRDVAFTSDGAILAIGANSLVLWEMAKRSPLGSPLESYSRQDGALVAFSPDGHLFASCDKVFINLRNTMNFQLVGPPLRVHKFAMEIPNNYGVQSLAFSPDSKELITFTFDGTIWTWDLDDESWANRACRMANRNLTLEEWRRYMGDVIYQPVCPDFPSAEDETGQAARLNQGGAGPDGRRTRTPE